MLHLNEIPAELKTIVDSEKADFIIKAKRKHPVSKSLASIFFSIIWLSFTSIFVVAFLGPLFQREEVHYESNGTPSVGSIDDWEHLLFPGLFIGFFLIIGIAILMSGLYTLFHKGGYFVGTATRLIQYNNGSITVTDWEQFTGSIQIKSKRDLGDLEFQLRTGKMQSRKNSSDKFVPDTIYMAGIENVFDIEKKCRIRIKENDPSPVINN